MFLRVPRSYIASDQALNFISNWGFHLTYPEISTEDGTKKALLTLEDHEGAPMALEFCEILDEVLFANKEPYGKQFLNKHSPLQTHWSEIPLAQASFSVHPNTVYCFSKALLLESLTQEPWAEYLRIRKNSSLAAVHLFCRDLHACRHFQNFDREYQIGSRKLGLIHLGPSSFDLLIEEFHSELYNTPKKDFL